MASKLDKLRAANLNKNPLEEIKKVSGNELEPTSPSFDESVNSVPVDVARSISNINQDTSAIPGPHADTAEQAEQETKVSKAIKSPAQRKAVLLLKELNKVMRIQKTQLNMSIDEYFAHIIDKEMAEASLGLGRHGEDLFDSCYRSFMGPKERVTVVLSEEHHSFVDTEVRNAGITFADYANYLVKKWKDK